MNKKPPLLIRKIKEIIKGKKADKKDKKAVKKAVKKAKKSVRGSIVKRGTYY